MTKDVRHYWWLRMTVLGTSLVIFASLCIASAQLWPIAQRLIAPTKLACGCAIVSITTPWWLTTIAVLVISLTIGLAAAGVILFFKHLGRSRYQEQQLRELPLQEVTETNTTYTLVETARVFAMTIGFWKPTMYISRGMINQLTRDELAAVVAHERAHQRAHDPVVTAVMSVVSSLFAWLPGARGWMSAAYSLRELAADAAATNGYQSTEALSSAFLKLSTTTLHPSISAFSPNRDRLEKLLNHDWSSSQRWWNWSALGIVIVIASAALSFGHIAAAKSPTVPMTAASLCHETIVMCEVQRLPTLPTGWLCVDGRCTESLHLWSPLYEWTPVR